MWLEVPQVIVKGLRSFERRLAESLVAVIISWANGNLWPEPQSHRTRLVKLQNEAVDPGPQNAVCCRFDTVRVIGQGLRAGLADKAFKHVGLC